MEDRYKSKQQIKDEINLCMTCALSDCKPNSFRCPFNTSKPRTRPTRQEKGVDESDGWGNYGVCVVCNEETPPGPQTIQFDCKIPGHWWHFHGECWKEMGTAFLKEWRIDENHPFGDLSREIEGKYL